MAIIIGNKEYKISDSPLNPYTLHFVEEGVMKLYIGLEVECLHNSEITDFFRLDGAGPFSPATSVSQLLASKRLFQLEPFGEPYHEGCYSFTYEISGTLYNKLSFSLCRITDSKLGVDLHWTGCIDGEEREVPFSIRELLAPLRVTVAQGVEIPSTVRFRLDEYERGRVLIV